MLYSVPDVGFTQEILAHKYQPLAEVNAFDQARRTRIIPKQVRVSNTIKLKSGRVLQPGRGPVLSGTRMGAYYGPGLHGIFTAPGFSYAQKSPPYLSKRSGMGGITDFFSGVSDALKGGANIVKDTASGIGTTLAPIESLVTDNPTLLNLLKSYVPTLNKPSTPTTINLASPVPTTTLGVSNKVWVYGSVALGGLGVYMLLRKKRR